MTPAQLQTAFHGEMRDRMADLMQWTEAAGLNEIEGKVHDMALSCMTFLDRIRRAMPEPVEPVGGGYDVVIPERR